MQTTQTTIDLIKQFEGFRPGAYFCPAGVQTIGYGTTCYKDGERVQIGDEIDHDSAEQELFFHLRREIEPALSRIFPGIVLEPGLRDALGSFAHNIGADWGAKWPTLKALIDAGATRAEICDQLVKYCNSGGQPLLGLKRRRLAECCVIFGVPWQSALGADMDTDWRELVGFHDPDLEIPHPGAARSSDELNRGEASRIRPTEPLTTEDLNTRELERVSGQRMPRIGVRRTQPVPLEPKAEDPYTNPETGNKPIERSERVEGYTREREGERWLGIVGKLFPMGAGTAAFGFFEGSQWWETLALLAGVLVFIAIIAEWRRRQGVVMKERGRLTAAQPLE